MERSAKEAFAARLVEAMHDAGHASTRNAKTGVNVAPLAAEAKVTREMARRYAEGEAVPGVNKMQLIATWLGVRLAWLRDGDGPKRPVVPGTQEPAVAAYLPEEAQEIARVWLKLPRERQAWFRDLMCLEAVVASHYPWLMFGRPRSESYDQYEIRVGRDGRRLAERLTHGAGKA